MTPQEFRALREQTGLNQTQRANEWGVADRTVRRWEAGDVPITPIAAYALQMMVTALPRPSRGLSDDEVEAILNGSYTDAV